MKLMSRTDPFAEASTAGDFYVTFGVKEVEAQLLNEAFRKGWKLHSCLQADGLSMNGNKLKSKFTLVFERRMDERPLSAQ